MYNTTLKDYENSTISNIDRDSIRQMLRKSLKPNSSAKYKSHSNWPKWLQDRLTTLAIYSYSNKTECDEKQIMCLRLYSNGYDYNSIARDTKLKKRTVEKYIYLALDWVIDNTPDYLLNNIPTEFTRFRLGACPHCKGDLLWDDTEGQYWCLACARRFNEQNQSVTIYKFEAKIYNLD
jgi:hypothetical protein